MPQFTAPANPQNRLDSDREVLDFPEGGVFGKEPEATTSRRGNHVDTLRLAQDLDRTLDDMQDQLDELARDVDGAIAFPSEDGDDWPAPAA